MSKVDHEADLAKRFCPSPDQVRVATAMLYVCPGSYAVCVPICLPGKDPGWWEAGQVVSYPPGYFLAITNTRGETESYAVARDEAEAAAVRALGRTSGVAAWASIHSDGHWAVFEGVSVGHARNS